MKVLSLDTSAATFVFEKHEATLSHGLLPTLCPDFFQCLPILKVSTYMHQGVYISVHVLIE